MYFNFASKSWQLKSRGSTIAICKRSSIFWTIYSDIYLALKECNVDEDHIEGADQFARFPCVMCLVCQDQSVHKASRYLGVSGLRI